MNKGNKDDLLLLYYYQFLRPIAVDNLKQVKINKNLFAVRFNLFSIEPFSILISTLDTAGSSGYRLSLFFID